MTTGEHLEPDTPDTPQAQDTAHPVVSVQTAAAQAYVRLGSYAAVGRELGLPVSEVQRMARTMYWQDEVAAYQREQQAVLDARLTQLLGRTLEEVEDRLAYGDWRMDKNGKEVRLPVTASTLASLANVIFNQRQIIRNQPTSIAGDTQKLQTLSEKLRMLGAKDITVIENGGQDGAQEER